MKKLMVVLALVIVSTASFAKCKEDIKVLSTKRHVLYFKSDKDMIGATIEVEDFNHHIMESSVVESSKTIVDFFFLPVGEYTVKIKKDGKEYDIQYSNK